MKSNGDFWNVNDVDVPENNDDTINPKEQAQAILDRMKKRSSERKKNNKNNSKKPNKKKIEVTPEMEHYFQDLVDSGGEGINHWFHVVVTEGRNRVVRKLWESQDITVNRLKRVRFGPIFLPKSLRKGAWLELDKQQIKHLYQHCETTSVVAQ